MPPDERDAAYVMHEPRTGVKDRQADTHRVAAQG